MITQASVLGGRRMKYKPFILFCSFLLAVILTEGQAASGSGSPLSAGGFTLGTSINDYDFISQENFVEEVVIPDIKGFRKGFVTYGTCYRPGEIIRIKLKYKDGSDDFFEKLLKQYRKKFGSRPVFVGDPFGKVKAWKWEFTVEDGRRVTLTLQHNLENDEESIGNTIKLGLPDQLIAERECSNTVNSPDKEEASEELIITDWELLLPK